MEFKNINITRTNILDVDCIARQLADLSLNLTNHKHRISDITDFPTPLNNEGKILTVVNSSLAWVLNQALPPVANQAGKFLTNNGVVPSWASIPTPLQADWNQTNSTSLDFIKNKPSIPEYVSDLVNDLGFVRDILTLSINGVTYNLSANRSWSVGSVSSVGLIVPTGFTSGSPVTTSGSLILAFDTGYSLPSNSSQSNWDQAYSWGNHALMGYITGESDTLATVTSRGSSTSTNLAFNGGFSASSGIINGLLTVSPTSDATFTLRANSGANTARILFNNAGSSVWALFKDSTISDFKLYNYSIGAFAMTVSVGTNAVIFGNTITATSIIKSGGLSTQFLKADGSVDNNTYLTTSQASNYIEKAKYIVDEIPSGAIDGINATFTLANIPLTGKLMVFINGIKMEAGYSSDYTISGNIITINAGAIPQTGDKISATYIY